jgi:GDP-4-dehydro-6-deoxy-D-mannose reductase
MKILITGMTGFAGSHLADFILKEKLGEIHAVKRWRSLTENIDHLMDKINLYECDLRDAFSVRDLIDKVRPDRIFHLAAQSFVPTSWTAPTESLSTNILGQLNIFEAVRKIGIDPLIQIACSSEEYGMVYPDEVPIKETNPLRPLSPYAVSKVGQDMLGYQYFKSYGTKVVRTRGFNHTGPRRAPVFVCSDFAKQIVNIEFGKKEPVIAVGNLEARRDFTDVRDTVVGYWLALDKAEPGEVYNICSGTDHKINDILDSLLQMTDIDIDVCQDPDKMRPSDVQILKGDNSKFTQKTGWKITIPFEKTLEDLMDYWRRRNNSKSIVV